MKLMSNHQFLSQAASVGPLQVLQGAFPLASLLLFREGLEVLLIIGRFANQAAFLMLWHLAKTPSARNTARNPHSLRQLSSGAHIPHTSCIVILEFLP